MFLYCTFALDMTAEIKNNILQKVTALFFKYGIKSVTMDDIARELGMSKKTLYQFFDNKNDLVMLMFQHEEERDIEITNAILVKAENAVDELMGFAKHGIEEFAKIMSSPTIVYDLNKYYREIWQKFERSIHQRIYEGTKNNIERGKKEGLYRPEIDADIVAKLYVRQMMSFIDDEFFPVKHYNKVQLFTQYLIYHIHGIATPKGITLFEEKMKALFNN
jgi:TetR/AcrR family transcriptional regulator, cholesterol catabolism regulator